MHGNSRDKRIGAHLVHAIGYDTIIVIVRLSIPEFGIWSFKDKDKPSLLSTRARGSCSIPKDFHFRSRDKGDLERGAGGETLTLTICSHPSSMAHEELPIPIFSSLEPVFGEGSPLDEAQLRFQTLKAKFVEFFGHEPDVYARAPGDVVV